MDRRPNAELSLEEKMAKRNRKKLLKQQMKRRKLEMRLQQALRRNDEEWIQKSRQELNEFLHGTKEIIRMMSEAETTTSTTTSTSTTTRAVTAALEETINETDDGPYWTIWSDKKITLEEKSARDRVEQCYHELQRRLRHDAELMEQSLPSHISEDDKNQQKEYWIQKSRGLLKNMTRGTQTESMFQDAAALLGYTRTKFMSRACLALESLYRLVRITTHTPTDDEYVNQCAKQMVHNLQRRVRSVYSIGCGPGCDAVGIWSFIVQQQQQQKCPAVSTQLERILLLDYTMQQWEPIAQHVKNIIMERHETYTDESEDNNKVNGSRKPSSLTVSSAFCDVRARLFSVDDDNDENSTTNNVNKEVATMLLSERACRKNPNKTITIADPRKNCSSSSSSSKDQPVDILVASYLLSETRDKWHFFMDDMILSFLKPGSLVLLSDPVAWQLHIFRERYHDTMDFIWLDSSMYRPELQPMHGRVGAAVLVGMVK